jgi:hypothetical protein
VNEVSFCTRPHHNVHNTLGVDAGATSPRWRVDSIEGGRIERKGGPIGRVRWDRAKDTSNKEPFVLPLRGWYHCVVNCSSLVLLVLVGCFLIFFCIKVCSLHILWCLC